MNLNLDRLPGGDLVTKWLYDLSLGTLSEEALLVLIAAPRLETLGFKVPRLANQPAIPEHALYDLVSDRNPEGAHAAYNALMARMVSFANTYYIAARLDEPKTLGS